MPSAIPAIGGSLVSSIFNKNASDKARKTAGINLPDQLSTGRSKFNTRTGELDLDPTIRANQGRSRANIRRLRPEIDDAFSRNTAGIRDLQDRSADIQTDFEGNQSAFREAQLAPLQEGIARGRGDLDRELGRTNVRGTFANQARSGFEFDSSRELRNAEAQIENQRINTLGDFLQIDADFLKQGLASETGKVGMLAELESIISGMNSEQFDQEMRGLGLFGQFTGAAENKANRIGDAEGIVNQGLSTLAGDIVGGIGSFGGSGGSTNSAGATSADGGRIGPGGQQQ